MTFFASPALIDARNYEVGFVLFVQEALHMLIAYNRYTAFAKLNLHTTVEQVTGLQLLVTFAVLVADTLDFCSPSVWAAVRSGRFHDSFRKVYNGGAVRRELHRK